MPTDLRRDRGSLGERIAAEHLERRGYRIVDRNYRTRHGELDIVAADERALIFCAEDERALVGGDDVELAVTRAVVAVDDSVSAALEVLCRDPLAEAAAVAP